MRVAIVIVSNGNDEKLRKIASALSKGISSQGHEVDIIDGKRDTDKKLTFYEYIVLGTENTTFFGGKIPQSVSSFLRQAGTVSGKRCFAFVLKKGLRSQKTLKVLMKLMESEGMFLKISDIISKTSEAEEIGKRLHVRRS